MSFDARRCLTIVLAAGEGVRMRSSRPKVLHAVAGRPMIAHALAAAREAGAADVAVVVGPDREDVAEAAREAAPGAEVFVQRERRGRRTRSSPRGRRSRAATTTSSSPTRTFRSSAAATLAALRAGLAEGADLVALGFAPADPTGYGRLIERDGRLVAIREHKDATRGRAGGAALQRGPDGLRRRRGARDARGGDAAQRPEGILPDRPRRDRRRARTSRRGRSRPTRPR